MYLHQNSRLSKARGKALARRGADCLRESLLPHAVQSPFPFLDQIGRRCAHGRRCQGPVPPAQRDPNVTGTALEVALQVMIGRIRGQTTRGRRSWAP